MSIFDGWYFFTQKWEVFAWIVRIRTASITRKRKRRTISCDAICLVAVIARKDIVKSSSAGKESRCDMEKSNVEKAAEEIIEENKRLKMKLDDCNCKIKVMQNHIDCLKAGVAEARERKFELPIEPIKIASMLIDATETKVNCMTGKEYDKSVYEKWQLEQIAMHLLVYFGKCEDWKI